MLGKPPQSDRPHANGNLAFMQVSSSAKVIHSRRTPLQARQGHVDCRSNSVDPELPRNNQRKTASRTFSESRASPHHAHTVVLKDYIKNTRKCSKPLPPIMINLRREKSSSRMKGPLMKSISCFENQEKPVTLPRDVFAPGLGSFSKKKASSFCVKNTSALPCSLHGGVLCRDITRKNVELATGSRKTGQENSLQKQDTADEKGNVKEDLHLPKLAFVEDTFRDDSLTPESLYINAVENRDSDDEESRTLITPTPLQSPEHPEHDGSGQGVCLKYKEVRASFGQKSQHFIQESSKTEVKLRHKISIVSIGADENFPDCDNRKDIKRKKSNRTENIPASSKKGPSIHQNVSTSRLDETRPKASGCKDRKGHKICAVQRDGVLPALKSERSSRKVEHPSKEQHSNGERLDDIETLRRTLEKATLSNIKVIQHCGKSLANEDPIVSDKLNANHGKAPLQVGTVDSFRLPDLRSDEELELEEQQSPQSQGSSCEGLEMVTTWDVKSQDHSRPLSTTSSCSLNIDNDDLGSLPGSPHAPRRVIRRSSSIDSSFSRPGSELLEVPLTISTAKDRLPGPESPTDSPVSSPTGIIVLDDAHCDLQHQVVHHVSGPVDVPATPCCSPVQERRAEQPECASDRAPAINAMPQVSLTTDAGDDFAVWFGRRGSIFIGEKEEDGENHVTRTTTNELGQVSLAVPRAPPV